MGRSSGRMSVKLHTRPFWLFSELFELAEAIEITPVFLVEELEKMAQWIVTASQMNTDNAFVYRLFIWLDMSNSEAAQHVRAAARALADAELTVRGIGTATGISH